MTARVRDFVYLDPGLVAQTLSQLDYGLFKEWEETLERTSGKDASLQVNLFGLASGGGGGQKSAKTGSAVVLEQTAESYASRLLFRLEETGELVRLDADPARAVELRRGTVTAAESVMVEFDSTSGMSLLEADGWRGAPMVALYEAMKEAEATPVLMKVGSYGIFAMLPTSNVRIPLDQAQDDWAELIAIVRRTFRKLSGEMRTLAIARPIAVY